MSPRTNSPPPSSYCSYDDIDYTEYHPGPSFHPPTLPGGRTLNDCQQQFYSVSTKSDIAGTHTRTNNNHKDNAKGFTSILLRPLNIPRRILSSSVVQVASVMMIYSICIMTVWFIFCTSYVLTFCDDTQRVLRNSRAWAKVKNGVREKISMLGDDWEEFLHKYFDQPWDGVDVNSNGHLGNNKPEGPANGCGSSREAGWDDWIKGSLLRFITVVAGQDVTNKFQQSAPSFRSRSSTAGGF